MMRVQIADKEKEAFLNLLIEMALEEDFLSAKEIYAIGFYVGTTLAKEVSEPCTTKAITSCG